MVTEGVIIITICFSGANGKNSFNKVLKKLEKKEKRYKIMNKHIKNRKIVDDKGTVSSLVNYTHFEIIQIARTFHEIARTSRQSSVARLIVQFLYRFKTARKYMYILSNLIERSYRRSSLDPIGPSFLHRTSYFTNG